MKIIEINASSPYRAVIGRGASSLLCDAILEKCPEAKQIAIVSDDNVFPLYGEKTKDRLTAAGYEPSAYIIPNGEASKTYTELYHLLEFLARNGFSRSDALIALGGGVVGDLAGFAAAVYMRGISFFQMPTTFLSAIDSSVGGKTAVDLPEGKNMIGAFWQPKAVICDIDHLDTLPYSVFTDGCAEAIKTAVLFDPALFSVLSQTNDPDRESVISRCIEHKRDIVVCDEFDKGTRGLLNFGHTLGHAVESCSDYSLSHGRSVAIGMSVVSRAAARAGICDAGLPAELSLALKRYDLPTNTSIPMETLLLAMLSDKKRKNGMTNVIVPRRIGKCEIMPMSDQQLRVFMESGFLP